MRNSHKILVSCLTLLALWGPSAQAVTLTVENNPGVVGEPAQPLAGWSVNDPDIDTVNLVFTDNKTLESGPGALGFFLGVGGSTDGVSYTGFLLDASGSAIPGTDFFGIVGVDAASVGLAAPTVFSGMRFTSAGSAGSFELGGYAPIVWVGGTPTVGVIPIPAAAWLFGSALGLLGWVRRRTT